MRSPSSAQGVWSESRTSLILPHDIISSAPHDIKFTDESKVRAKRATLEQYHTPIWAANALVEKFFSDLAATDAVVEPSCGHGAFLGAIPPFVRAVGVEIDSDSASRAAENTGREVICGDFHEVTLPFQPTAIIGNPPFSAEVVHGFLDRAFHLLPDNGRCGFILPAHTLGYTGPVLELAERWSIEQSILPKSLFPRLSVPIIFALLRKEKVRRLFGFCLFDEASAIMGMPKPVKLVLTDGKPGKSVWRAVVEDAVTALGGKASLAQIYAYVEGRRPRIIQTWRDTIRRVLQEGPFKRVGQGEWAFDVKSVA